MNHRTHLRVASRLERARLNRYIEPYLTGEDMNFEKWLVSPALMDAAPCQ